MQDEYININQAYRIASALENGARHRFEGYQGYLESLHFTDGKFVLEVYAMPNSTEAPVDTKYYEFDDFVKMLVGKKLSWYKELLNE